MLLSDFGAVPPITTFRPMLAPQEEPTRYKDYFKKLQYPLLGSIKYDGIRGAVRDALVMSRTWKPLPSYQVQDEFSIYEFADSEIIEGDPFSHDVYNRTQSHVMSADKPGELAMYVFDFIHPKALNLPFYQRLELAWKAFSGHDNVKVVEHVEIDNEDELLEFEEKALALGAEGIMMRNPVGIYKNGARCTFNEGLIYKLKRFEVIEAKVIGFEERMHNTNVQERDERGYAKRSSSKEGKVGSGIAGKLIVFYEGKEHPVAPGIFKHPELLDMWLNPHKYIGRYLKVKHFPKGAKDGLRQPRAMGWRDKMDMVKD